MLARLRDPRVVPVEVWDLIVDGVPLYRAPRGDALARAAEALASGRAESESGTSFPGVCRAIRRVALVGGAAGAIAWRSQQIPAERARHPERCAEDGGMAILARMGKRGLVVDLGQSRLKIRSNERRRVYERDFEAVPARIPPDRGPGRPALVSFVAAALRAAAIDAAPEAIVLALPCEVSDDGAIGTCSYPWQRGDAIVPDILAEAGLSATPTWLVNDAELAALGLAERGVVQETTLVLTLGFGVGGAVLRGGA